LSVIGNAYTILRRLHLSIGLKPEFHCPLFHEVAATVFPQRTMSSGGGHTYDTVIELPVFVVIPNMRRKRFMPPDFFAGILACPKQLMSADEA
jgi:hypothetical protein